MSVKLNLEKLKYIGSVSARKTTKDYSPIVLRIPREIWWVFDIDLKAVSGTEKRATFDVYVDVDNRVIIYVKR